MTSLLLAPGLYPSGSGPYNSATQARSAPGNQDLTPDRTAHAMTTDNLHLRYDRTPGFLPIYRRLLLGRRARHEKGAALPAFHAVWPGARADAALVKRYAEVCGLPDDGFYPLLYPHILTSPIHIDIISRPEFPLSPMGAVHTRMHVLQHAPIAADAAVDIECKLVSTRVLKAGIEFEITTTLAQNGVKVWESLSANLIRGKKFGEPEEPSDFAQLPDPEGELVEHGWSVPRDMGWRYAKITGDYNPIHVSRVLAKFMGFDRDLIHGMWSAARCLAHLPQLDTARPIRADILFKGPVYMESTVTLKHATGESGQSFDLYCAGNPRPVIRGRVRQENTGATLAP